MKSVWSKPGILAGTVLLLAASGSVSLAADCKAHAVFLGAVKTVPYSKAGDPAGARADETALKLRALLVDGQVKEWTTGDSRDVTDRSFGVRRVLKINDALPGDKQGHWVRQHGPWLLVDRTTGRITALKLPDYNSGVSQVSWFRDYVAYCSVASSGKSLYAVVAQLAAFDAVSDPPSACAPVEWQHEPLRVVFHPAQKDPVSCGIVPGSAALVDDSGDDADPAPAPKTN